MLLHPDALAHFTTLYKFALRLDESPLGGLLAEFAMDASDEWMLVVVDSTGIWP